MGRFSCKVTLSAALVSNRYSTAKLILDTLKQFLDTELKSAFPTTYPPSGVTLDLDHRNMSHRDAEITISLPPNGCTFETSSLLHNRLTGDLMEATRLPQERIHIEIVPADKLVPAA